MGQELSNNMNIMDDLNRMVIFKSYQVDWKRLSLSLYILAQDTQGCHVLDQTGKGLFLLMY